MFLAMLNDEQKKYFGRLISLVANIDGEVSEEENEVIEGYKRELGLESLDEINHDIDEVIKYFSKEDTTIKKSVFLEVVTLVLSDDIYERSEKEVVEKMANSFNITNEKKEEFITVVKDLQDVYGRLFDLVY